MIQNIDIKILEEVAIARGKPFKALIVDDEKMISETFKEFCQITKAIEVEIAYSAFEAIEKIKSCELDIATVDLIMPEKSGLELLTEIKALSPTLPVIIVTGNATEKLIHEAGLMGASRILYKPIDLVTFVSEIASTLMGK